MCLKLVILTEFFYRKIRLVLPQRGHMYKDSSDYLVNDVYSESFCTTRITKEFNNK